METKAKTAREVAEQVARGDIFALMELCSYDIVQPADPAFWDEVRGIIRNEYTLHVC